MKKAVTIGAMAVMVATIACTDVKRDQNRVYMPDMAYSRAYETYIARDTNKFTMDQNEWDANGQSRIFFNNQPVPGTVARGESYVYHLQKDKVGDSSNYIQARATVNPIPKPDSIRMIETERIYLINCAICHGPKLDGNGPLYKGGEGPYPAKPANLSGTDPQYANMSEGTMFYSITYGKNLMGSYAGQVSPQQRWEIIHYIKDFQAKTLKSGETPPAVGGAAAQSSPSANGTDSSGSQQGSGQQGGNQQGGSQPTGSNGGQPKK